MNYEIMSVRRGEEGKYLEDGWEPFGVVVHHGSYRFLNTTEGKYQNQLTNTDYIYLRKKVSSKSRK